MKKTFKKITAMLLTALFMVNLLPTGASAANPVESGIEPRDSGGYIYQYYDTCPAGWNDITVAPNEWEGNSFNEMIYLTLPLSAYTAARLAPILRPYVSEFLTPNGISVLASCIVSMAGAVGANVTNFRLSLTHMTNTSREPLQTLNYYTFVVSGIGTDNFYELATLN